MMDEPLEKWSAIWPRSGMTVNGRCYPLPTLVRPTSASASGLWPTALADGDRTTKFKQGGTPLGVAVRHWPTPRASMANGPSQKEIEDGDPKKRLETAVKVESRWPTPTARDWKDGSYCPNVPVNGLLGRAVWPTPDTRGFTNQGAIRQLNQNLTDHNEFVGMTHRVGHQKREAAWTGDSSTPRSEVSGSLNPQWVEWLMGYPSGWTDLED